MSKNWRYEDEDYTDEEKYEWARYLSENNKRTHVGKLPRKRGGGRNEFEVRRSVKRARRDCQRTH
jgi:hypothetical protein